VDVALVAGLIVAFGVSAKVWQVRAQRRAERLKLSGGRRSLVMNLFDRR
jgi:hypothetical protein